MPPHHSHIITKNWQVLVGVVGALAALITSATPIITKVIDTNLTKYKIEQMAKHGYIPEDMMKPK